MKKIIEFLQEKIGMTVPSIPVMEMATVDRKVKVGNDTYRVALHGPAVGDRPTPHFHIYLSDDCYPYNKFNIEVSLVDLLCYGELTIVSMRDKSKGVDKRNKMKCSWEGYRKLHNKIEDWLTAPCVGMRGDFIDNLDAIIWTYDNESNDGHSLLDYIQDHGKKVLPTYQKYFASGS